MLNSLGKGWCETTPNAFGEALAHARASGRPLIDLVSATAEGAGLGFPAETQQHILSDAARLVATERYAPDALGRHAAREAIAGYYQRRGLVAEPQAIVLTPGSSMGYLYTMRLLTEPGDEILVPSPGYPLFDDLARLCGLRLRRYHLRESTEGWTLDPEEVAFQCTPRTRLLMLVSPHNPTGCVLGEGELAALAAVCREKRLPAIFDEVFCEFLEPGAGPLPRPVGFPLCVTLNGFSKMFALPGWKVGWMKADGDGASVAAFMRAVEHLSDTFLPMSELFQAATPAAIEAGDPEISAAMGAEIAVRRHKAWQLLGGGFALPDAGVYLCPRLAAEREDEEAAMDLLGKGIVVHPGYFYDLPNHLVVTCLGEKGSQEDAFPVLSGAVLGGK